MPEFDGVRSLAPADDVSAKAVAAARQTLNAEMATGSHAAHSAPARVRRRDRLRPHARRGIAVGVAVLAVVAVTGGVIAGLRLTSPPPPAPMASPSSPVEETALLVCETGTTPLLATKVTEPVYADELDEAGRATLDSATDGSGAQGHPILGELSDWIVAEQTSDTLRLLRPRAPLPTDVSWNVPPTFEQVVIGLHSGGGGWMSAITPCTVTVDLADLAFADVTVDPAFGLDPEASELHLLVSEEACNSGRDATGRIELRTKEETDDEVSLLIGVRPAGGAQACPSNPATPFIVQLDAPLGDRAVMDLFYLPARELEILDRMQLLPPE